MARRETSLAAAQQRLGTGPVRLTTSLDEALRGADLVVETIVEDAEPKREVLARAEKLAGSDAILTTNTSSLPLSALAEASAGRSALPACTSSTRPSWSSSWRS